MFPLEKILSIELLSGSLPSDNRFILLTKNYFFHYNYDSIYFISMSVGNTGGWIPC